MTKNLFGCKRTIRVPRRLLRVLKHSKKGDCLQSPNRVSFSLYLVLRRWNRESFSVVDLGVQLDVSDSTIISATKILISEGLISADLCDGNIRNIHLADIIGPYFDMPVHFVIAFIPTAPPGAIECYGYLLCLEQTRLKSSICEDLVLCGEEVAYMIDFWVNMGLLRWNGPHAILEPILNHVRVLHNAQYIYRKYNLRTEDEVFYLPLVVEDLPFSPAHLCSLRTDVGLKVYGQIRIELDFSVPLAIFLYEFCWANDVLEPWKIYKTAKEWYNRGIRTYRLAIAEFSDC